MLRPILILCLVFVGASGCQKQAATPAVRSNKISKTDSVNLEADWPAAKVFFHDYESSSHTSFPEVKGQEGGGARGFRMGGTRESTHTTSYILTTIAKHSSSQTELLFELQDFSMSTAFGEQTFGFNTGGESLDGNGAENRETLNKILGSKVKLYLNATNYIVRFNGLGELMAKFTQGGGGGGRGGGGGFRPGIMGAQQLNDAFFRQIVRVHQPLPKEIVKIGEKWKADFIVNMENMGSRMVVVPVDCEFVGWEKIAEREVARIDYSGDIQKSQPQAQGGFFRPQQGPAFNLEDAKFKGSSWFDPNLKVVTDWNVEITGKFPMNFGNGRRGNQGTAPVSTTPNYANYSQKITVQTTGVKDVEAQPGESVPKPK